MARVGTPVDEAGREREPGDQLWAAAVEVELDQREPVRQAPSILADQVGSIPRLPRAAQAVQHHNSWEVAMKARLIRLAYSLAALAALAAALGAGRNWR